jgi:hypothetical protein
MSVLVYRYDHENLYIRSSPGLHEPVHRLKQVQGQQEEPSWGCSSLGRAAALLLLD